MIGFVYTTLALTAASSVSALVLPRVPVPDQPAGWATDYLEPYATYHTRYLAIGCQNQHNTQFFTDCCHPLLATETLEDARPAKCIPSADDASPSDTSDDSTDDSTDDSETEYNNGDSAPPAANALSAVTPSGDNSDSGNGSGSHSGNHKGGNNNSPSSDNSDPAPAPSSDSSSDSSDSSNKNGGKNGGGKNSGNTDGGNSGNDGGNPVTDTVGDAAGAAGDLITGGFATFYEQGGVAGACGDFHSDSDFVAAMDYRRYGDVDAKSSLCGKTVHITNTNNGKSVDVTIVDACPTCDNENCIDLTPAAFNTIATPEEGEVPISWSFT